MEDEATLFSGTPFWWWLAACAAGGTIAGLGLSASFFGQLILFGGLLGSAQALAVRYFLAAKGVSGLWIALSFVGWGVGSTLSALIPISISPIDLSVAGVAVQSLPWLILGLFQMMLLVGVLGPRSFGLWPYTLLMLWAITSAIGGGLTEAARLLTTTSAAYRVVSEALGQTITTSVQLAILTTLLYGILTGVVWTGIVRLANSSS